MMSTILILLTLTAVGVTIAAAIGPQGGEAGALLGEGMLIGVAAPPLVLFAMALLALPWSLPAVAAVILCIAGIAVTIVSRRRPFRSYRERAADLGYQKYLALAADLLTLTLLIGYAFYATTVSGSENGFIGIWGVKARTFLEVRGIDWDFLSDPSHESTHPDYPPLIPLLFAFLSMARGGWDLRSIGLLFPFITLGVLLIVRQVLWRQSNSTLVASMGTLAVASLAMSPYIGLAEGPLIAFSTAGVLILREAVRPGNELMVTKGALLIGLAALTKNEGVTIAIAVAIAFGLVCHACPRRVLSLWPAVLVPLIWTLCRFVFGLHTDLTSGPMAGRVWKHLHQVPDLVRIMMRHPPGNGLFWIGVGLGLLLTLRRALREEIFTTSVIGLQYSFVLLAYLSTPQDLEWHIQWSFDRVVSQQALLLAVFVILLLVGWDRAKRAARDGSLQDGPE